MEMTGAQPERKIKLRGLGESIAAKLYCFAFLSLLAVGSLSIASIYFSRSTESAAHRLYGDSFLGVLNSTRLELLLANHRRIVESMPPEVDRDRLHADRAELEEIKNKLLALMQDIGEKRQTGEAKPGDPRSLELRIDESLPALFDAAEQVAFFANEFAQDKAVEQANDYAYVANGIERMIKEHRSLRLLEAQQAIAFVTATAKSLMVWVLLSALAAMVLIGPIGLTTMHRALTRLGRITQAMIQLSRNDTTTAIPSRHDRDEVGEMARAVEVFKDNAIQLIAREVELKQLNRRIDIALNNMTHGLCMFDAEHNLIVCNQTYVQMYSLTPELSQPGASLQGIDGYRAKIGNAALANPEQLAAADAIAAREASAFTQELMDGRIVAVSQRPMQDGGWVAVHEDITERRRAEAKIAHLARHDMLTNLPNRVLFREHLENEFSRIQLGRGFAVHCLDLDHFKTVNDTLGHPIGDELLKLVAARLIEAVPKTDFIARIGGDEFAVVQADVVRPEQCSLLASRIVELVSQPYDIDGRHIVIGTSIGIAIAPSDGSNPDILLKNADMALYLAKGADRGTHRFFEREMDKRLQARRALELDLRKAIANGEFEVYYQPIIDLRTGKVAGFEALLRWNHPERGQISPADFIPLAEETGLILPLGEWVLRTACLHAVKWPQPVGVAVNLSAMQFKGRNIVQLTVNALASSGLAAARLDLEITESVLLQDEANTLAILHQLRAIGVQISMDDFGTGYSSLAYLRNFPFDKIKIDRSFVRDMLVRKDCRAIVQAVVGLARSLGITTIIEGVETKEQLETAQADGCDLGQGYLFSKPMPEREVTAFLAKRERAAAAA
jgi:diguanylate cyclase (GGDEF)-like protein